MLTILPTPAALSAPEDLLSSFAASRACFEELVGWARDEEAAGLTHGELEERLTVKGRELLRRLLQDHLDLRAQREVRVEKVVGADEVVRSSVEDGHGRGLRSVFGLVTVTRLAYRRKGQPNLHPADMALNLPLERHSHGLRRLAAVEAAGGSFEEVREGIERSTGERLGKRQVEEMAERAAVDFDAFYAERAPTAGDPDDLLILTCDGKGIVMRPEALRPATAEAAEQATHKLQTRLSPGERWSVTSRPGQGRRRLPPARAWPRRRLKSCQPFDACYGCGATRPPSSRGRSSSRERTIRGAHLAHPSQRCRQGRPPPDMGPCSLLKRNRKRVAEVGGVYDAMPAPRTPVDVLAHHEKGREVVPGPVTRNKWLMASVVEDAAVVSRIFDEAERRDPGHRRTWVVLVDGNNHQIERIQAEARRRKVEVSILVDLIHVLEYLWLAARCFFQDDTEAEAWVLDKALEVLDGHAGLVAGAIRRSNCSGGGGRGVGWRRLGSEQLRYPPMSGGVQGDQVGAVDVTVEDADDEGEDVRIG